MAWLTLSAQKSRSPPIRHKGALGVRALLRDPSIYRPSNRREAEREAANRFAGIRPMLPNALRPAAASAAMSGRSPRSHRRGSTQRLPVQTPLPVDMPCGEQRDRVPRRSTSAYRPSRCGEGRVPRVPSPAVAACGCAVQGISPRAPRPIRASRIESLLYIGASRERGRPRAVPENPPDPRCVQNVKMMPKAK